MECPSITAIPLGVIRGNAFLRAAVTKKEIDRWKTLFGRHGPLAPLVVRPAKDGGFRVIAGERELEAARELKVSTADVVVVPLESDTEAHKLSLQLLSLRNSPNHLEEALIIREVLYDKTVSQADLAKLCGHSLSWVSKRLHLVQSLEDTVIDLVSQRVLAPATAQEIAKLPSAHQHAFACRVVADRIPKSVVEKLVSLYNASGASDELRKRILACPQDTLEAIRRDAERLGRPAVEEDATNKRLEKASRLLDRLLEEIVTLASTQPLSQRQCTIVRRIRELSEAFALRLEVLLETPNFPQGK